MLFSGIIGIFFVIIGCIIIFLFCGIVVFKGFVFIGLFLFNWEVVFFGDFDVVFWCFNLELDLDFDLFLECDEDFDGVFDFEFFLE